jgi:cystathionine gamma-synthase
MPPALPSSSLPLGHPLPLDEHACSVSLPTWCSVVGYEEGSPSVTNKLACGYPRFVYHPYVIQLMEAVLEIDKEKSQMEGQEFDCIVLPSRNSAIRCHDFLVKACGYLDGKAFSARLVNNVAMVHSIIGDLRVKNFFKR